jgi:hypothetical protein
MVGREEIDATIMNWEREREREVKKKVCENSQSEVVKSWKLRR